MRRSLLATACFATGVAVLLTAAAAGAAPLVRYNWDRCEPFVRNRDYEGPGVYAQTLSITGVPAGTTRLFFSIDVLVGWWYRAWEFYSGGCAGPARLTVVPGVAGCDSIPGLAVVIGEMSQVYDYGANVLTVDCVLDPSFVPDPARRYGVVTIAFDHELAETACEGATAPLCFVLGGGFYEAAGTLDLVVLENDRLTWNDHAPEPDCSPRMPPLPVRQSTWGWVKSLYR